MIRPVTLALIVATRFGLLLGLAVWTGLALATLLLTPILAGKLERAQADEVAGALFARVDRLLVVAVIVLAVSLGMRVALDQAAPPSNLLLPLGAMAASRLIAAFTVGPALRALRNRMRDANAPANEAERSAFGRLNSSWVLLLATEACLGLYALFAVS